MPTITMPKDAIYERTETGVVPEFYLKGKSAKRIDRRVGQALKEYNLNKIESLGSFLKREYPSLYQEYEGRSVE